MVGCGHSRTTRLQEVPPCRAHLKTSAAVGGRKRTVANKLGGGGSGIRTHDTVSRIHAFQACALSHSAIPPERAQYNPARARAKPAAPTHASRGSGTAFAEAHNYLH